jgi:hypothetical protein
MNHPPSAWCAWTEKNSIYANKQVQLHGYIVSIIHEAPSPFVSYGLEIGKAQFPCRIFPKPKIYSCICECVSVSQFNVVCAYFYFSYDRHWFTIYMYHVYNYNRRKISWLFGTYCACSILSDSNTFHILCKVGECTRTLTNTLTIYTVAIQCFPVP